MADTVLRSIEIRNWTKVRSAIVEFPEQGLVLVRGVNAASNGKMASIGSGKTALGEAISRTLLGVKGRFNNFGYYSTDESGDTYLKVLCEHKGKPLEVESGFKCEELSPTGEALRFKYDGVPTNRSLMDETRQDLRSLLTVPTELASWTVHLDGDKMSFDSMSEQKAVNLLMDALQQPRWTALNKKANNTASLLKHDLVGEREAVERAKSNAAQADVDLSTAKQNLSQAKASYKQEQANRKNRLTEITNEMTRLSGEVTRLKSEMTKTKKEIDRRVNLNAEKEKQLEISVNENQEKLDELNEARTPLSAAASRTEFAVGQAQRALERAEVAPKNCPTCGKAWDKAQEQINQQTTAVNEANTAADAADKKLRAHATKIATQAKSLAEAKKKLTDLKAEAPIDELSDQYLDLEEELEDVNASYTDFDKEKIQLEQGPDKTEITRFETQVSEREKALERANKDIDAAAAKVTEDEEMLRVVEYWQDAYSASGIPNMVLADALQPLNAVSKRISMLMSGGTLEVSYAASRQLAGGKGERAELCIQVQNKLGSKRIEGNSKGETQLTNLIVAETLAEVGGIAKRVGYRWYDEVLTNQDELVRRAYYAYLADVAHRQGILVFLVTHSPEAINYANFILVAEKTAEGTTYRWDC